jgi:hypothetical protein
MLHVFLNCYASVPCRDVYCIQFDIHRLFHAASDSYRSQQSQYRTCHMADGSGIFVILCSCLVMTCLL